ncbi:MAG: hypothetical protein K5854_00705 [Prevotella sp.]|jgi:hypothetical protein|nr:hypothetical protein [Prevotella sp.]
MKHDLSLILHEIETKLGKRIKIESPAKWSPKTLDHLALLAGFQNWNDLQTALHGGDAEL